MNRASIILLFLVISTTSDAWSKLTTAISSDFWTTASTWDNGVPVCGDSVIIPATYTVSIGSHLNLDETSACSTAMYISIEGTLHFNTGMKMYLPCNSFVDITGIITKGTGWGSSNIIQICQITVWSSSDADLSGPTSLGTALPVELLSFNVALDNDVAKLTWQTASEINNDYFTIERASDARHFKPVIMVDGAGNSREIIRYSAIDKNPLSGYSYYRLKQTDFNGQYSYSDINVLSISEIKVDEEQMTLFPNPNYGEFTIRLKLPVSGQMRIYDAAGACVFTQQVSKLKAIPVELTSDFLPGLYLVEISGYGPQYNTAFVLID